MNFFKIVGEDTFGVDETFTVPSGSWNGILDYDGVNINNEPMAFCVDNNLVLNLQY